MKITPKVLTAMGFTPDYNTKRKTGGFWYKEMSINGSIIPPYIPDFRVFCGESTNYTISELLEGMILHVETHAYRKGIERKAAEIRGALGL